MEKAKEKKLEMLLKALRSGGVHTNKIVDNYLVMPEKGDKETHVVAWGKMIIGKIKGDVFEAVEYTDKELSTAVADFKRVFNRVFKGKKQISKPTSKKITLGETKNSGK